MRNGFHLTGWTRSRRHIWRMVQTGDRNSTISFNVPPSGVTLLFDTTVSFSWIKAFNPTTINSVSTLLISFDTSRDPLDFLNWFETNVYLLRVRFTISPLELNMFSEFFTHTLSFSTEHLLSDGNIGIAALLHLNRFNVHVSCNVLIWSNTDRIWQPYIKELDDLFVVLLNIISIAKQLIDPWPKGQLWLCVIWLRFYV